jgi:hypothetical protein
MAMLLSDFLTKQLAEVPDVRSGHCVDVSRQRILDLGMMLGDQGRECLTDVHANTTFKQCGTDCRDDYLGLRKQLTASAAHYGVDSAEAPLDFSVGGHSSSYSIFYSYCVFGFGLMVR